MAKMAYRPEIDGLRAISVLMVLLFHAGFGFSGGFIGVDVFFVISGYLITGLVMKDLQADRFSFVEFWERRIRRIYPALMTMVVVTLLVGSAILLPEEFAQLANSAIAQALLVANYYFYDATGYFQGAADLKPLLHTWSLAVEEQFYLVLPLVLVAWKKWPIQKVQRGLLGLAFLSFGLSIWCTAAYPKIAFYFLPTRAWELLLGSLLAIAGRELRTTSQVNQSLSIAGLAGILIPGIWYSSETSFPGFGALPPCLGAVCLIFSNRDSLTWVGKMLALPWPVFIGKISYSLYLWHWPTLALLRHVYGESLPVGVRLTAVAMSFILAWISWKWVETPLRHPASMPRKWVFGMSTSLTLVLVGVSTSIIVSDGWRFRFSAPVLQLLEGSQIADLQEEKFVPVGPAVANGEPPAFLLWGDSHARAVSALIRNLAEEHQLSGIVASRSATIPALDTWRRSDLDSVQWNRRVVDFIKQNGIKNVIMASRWTINIDGRPNGSMNSLIIDDESVERSREDAGEVMRRALDKTFSELRQAGVKVWILEQVPQQKGDIPKLMAQQAMFPGLSELKRPTLKEHRQYQARVNEILAEFSDEHVSLLDPAPFCFDENGQALACDEECSYYSDDHHLSVRGAERMLTPLLAPVMLQIRENVELARRSRPASGVQQVSHQNSPVTK